MSVLSVPSPHPSCYLPVPPPLQSQGVDTSIPMDHGLQHQQSLAHANANLDSVLTHGSGIMTSLTGQKFTLKVMLVGVSWLY